ncbi:hypothetical protein GZH53_12045 [Flavihumibacter sp. R14]|nr:hypothetical protein [Flavihumibacter soli]
MIPDLPLYIPIVFGLTTVLTLIMFYLAVRKSPAGDATALLILVVLTVWLILQAAVTLSNFYSSDTRALPPRFVFLVLPPLLTILILFLTRKGVTFIDELPQKTMTFLHIVRVPVELVLYWLFLNKSVPQLMTFAGRNFDILAGITGPLVAYYGLQKQLLNRNTLLAWNFIGLALLLNIVIHAVLSAPFAFQQLAFDQPNIAVLYFPFSWLPGFVVPMVLFSHLVAIRQLTRSDITK